MLTFPFCQADVRDILIYNFSIHIKKVDPLGSWTAATNKPQF